MAKEKKKPAPERIPVTNFRLEPDSLADLDVIAEHYSNEFGVKVNRTGAVRLAIRNERRRVKPEKPKP